MKNKLIILFLAVVTIVFGFLRDYIFVSMNHSIESGADVNGYFKILKWILTGLFSILYMGITCAFLFFLFRSRKYIRITVGIYTAILQRLFSLAESDVLQRHSMKSTRLSERYLELPSLRL